MHVCLPLRARVYPYENSKTKMELIYKLKMAIILTLFICNKINFIKDASASFTTWTIKSPNFEASILHRNKTLICNYDSYVHSHTVNHIFSCTDIIFLTLIKRNHVHTNDKIHMTVGSSVHSTNDKPTSPEVNEIQLRSGTHY